MGAISTAIKVATRLLKKGAKNTSKMDRKYAKALEKPGMGKKYAKALEKPAYANPKEARVVMPTKASDGSIGKIKNDLAKQKLKLKSGEGKEKKLEKGISALQKRLGHVTKLTKVGVKKNAKMAKRKNQKEFDTVTNERVAEKRSLLNKRLKTATGKKRRKILEELHDLSYVSK